MIQVAGPMFLWDKERDGDVIRGVHCGTETIGRSLCNSAVFLKKGHVVGSQADADRSVVVVERFRGLG